MQKIKLVDKYQLAEDQTINQNGVSLIPARHNVENKFYTLKKINLNEQTRHKYLALVNQITILKELQHPSIIKCHRMLKTSHHLYIVYDFITNNSLQAYFSNQKNIITHQTRLEIAIQLIKVISFLKQKNIILLNLNPTNVQIIKPQNTHDKNNKTTIRLNNFEFAISATRPKDKSIIGTIPKSQYIDPEINSNINNIGFHSDVFSLAKILQFLQINKFEPTGNQRTDKKAKQKFTKVNSMINLMLITSINSKQNINSRPSIQQIYQFFCQENGEHMEKEQLNVSQKSLEMHHISQTRSTRVLPLRKTTLDEVNFSRIQNKQAEQSSVSNLQKKFRGYCLKIIKKRNLACFLLKCCEKCLNIDLIQYDLAVQTSFLFLKKSAFIVAQLSKFLYNGRDQEIKIPEKEVKLFFKTPDYFKLQAIVSKEMNYTKKYFNDMLSKINESYSNLMKNTSFQHETKSEKMNESFLKQKILEFIGKCIQNQRISLLQKQTLKYLLIMSYIQDFDTYEQMFDDLINEEIVELQKQTLFVKLEQMERQQLLKKVLDLRQKINNLDLSIHFT